MAGSAEQYDPIPNAAESAGGLPSVHVSTSPDTFGADIGKSIQGLGQVTERASDELYTRASAMQDLYNHTQALQANAAYTEMTTQKHMAFTALQGENAGPDALAAYTKDLSDSRNNIRASLTNPMAQKLFDSESLSTMNRTLFNGAGHSGEQVRVAADQTVQANIKASNEAVLQSPDDRTYKAADDSLVSNMQAQAQQKGWSEDTYNQNLADGRSLNARNRIIGTAKSDPIAAKALYDKANADGSLRGQDTFTAQTAVQNQLNTVGARQISSQINSGQLITLGAGQVTMDRAQDAVGNFESGGVYNKQGPVVSSGMYAGEQALGKYQIMPSNLPDWLKQSDLPPMTPQQFLANNDAQDKVFQTVFGGYMQKYGSFNEAAAHWFTGQSSADAAAKGMKDDNGTSVAGYLTGTNKYLAQTAGLSDKVAAARTQAANVAPDMPLLQDYAEQRVISDSRQQKAIDASDQADRMDSINDAILNPQNGKIPTNLDELRLASPDADKALDEMSSTEVLKVTKLLEHNQHDVPLTNDRLKLFNNLTGQSQNDPEGFAARDDILTQDVTMGQKSQLLGFQRKIRQNEQAFPDMKQGMVVSTPALQAAGINPKDDPDGYNEYKGALANELSAFAKDNGRPAKFEDIKRISANLLQQQTDPTSWVGSTTNFFKVPVPEKVADQIRSSSNWNGRQPTDREVELAYTRLRYQQMYGKKAPGAQPNE